MNGEVLSLSVSPPLSPSLSLSPFHLSWIGPDGIFLQEVLLTTSPTQPWLP